MSQKKGRFIVFEGLDGSGKSTQIKLFSEYLKSIGIENVVTCEPTSSDIGKMIRQMLSGNEKINPKTAALLFAADRIEHITAKDGMAELINKGVTVLCDRYYFSSYAYQMADMPLSWVIKINEMAKELLKPDLHIFVDLSPKDCMDRILKNRITTDIFENTERLTKVKNNFLEIFKEVGDSENILVVDGNRKPEEILDEIKEKTKYLF
ncbi:MAG: dTMP kinase [Oscillospiraceae bacterium]|nr:dTMP kinase [Oscillospiraceae bacterium]